MTPYEIIIIAQNTGTRLDAQWGVFITVHLALLGGIIYVDRPLRRLEKAGAIAVYAAFAFFNYRLTLSLRDLLERCAKDLSTRNSGPGGDEIVLSYFTDLSNSGHFAQAVVSITLVHIVSLLIVVVAICLDKRIAS